jgi:hypothetical protein
LPGDILQYDLRYWNEGDGFADGLSLEGRIPYSTFYLKDTVTPIENAELKYSIDRFFKITQQSLADMEKDIPKEIIKKLEGLKDREYENEKEFEAVIIETIGEEETEKYRFFILNNSVNDNKPKTYNLPPIRYKVKEVDEETGEEKEVEKIATPDMYTSIQWNLKDKFQPKEEVSISYRVKIK